MGAEFRLAVNSGWPDEVDDATDRYLHVLGPEIENDAKRYAAVDSGLMRSRIYHEVNRGELRVGVRNVDYWMTVEFGSGPHLIVPKTKKALHWPGAAHPVAKVNHPGTPVQPFLRPALYRQRGAL